MNPFSWVFPPSFHTPRYTEGLCGRVIAYERLCLANMGFQHGLDPCGKKFYKASWSEDSIVFPRCCVCFSFPSVLEPLFSDSDADLFAITLLSQLYADKEFPDQRLFVSIGEIDFQAQSHYSLLLSESDDSFKNNPNAFLKKRLRLFFMVFTPGFMFSDRILEFGLEIIFIFIRMIVVFLIVFLT